MKINENFEEVTTNKRFLTFSQAQKQAAEIQAKCADYNVRDVTLRNMHYYADANLLKFTNEGGSYGFKLTPYSLGQLCNKLGIPVKYITKCIENGNPYLAADNINGWLDDYHKDLFVRAYNGDTVRGILSSRFAVMDAPDVIDVFHDNMKGYEVRGMFVSPERLHMRVTQKEMLKVKGEDLFAGVMLDSSDVGRSTLTVRFFVYKQVCSNGLCISEDMGQIYTQRHVGLTKDEFQEELKENVRRIPEVASEMMRVIKEAAKEDRAFDIDMMEEKQQDRFKSRIKALTRLSDNDIVDVLNLMGDSYSYSSWGLVNAITEHAQKFTLDRRLELETVAGSIILHPEAVAA